MKNKFYKFYYLILGAFLLTQVSYTLYQTSFVVAHGNHQHDLKLSQVQLSKQKQKLEEQLAIKSSLSSLVNQNDLTNYQLISNPLIIEASTSLASLN